MTNPIDATAAPPTAEAIAEAITATATGQGTAKEAVNLLLARGEGYIKPTANARRHIAMAFAGCGFVVYRKTNDLVRVRPGVSIEFEELASVEQHIDDITLYEVKSTRRGLRADFSGYFFAITAAELLVAQSLKEERFRFVFVDNRSGHVLDLSLSEIFARAKGIYPTWSIRF